MRAVFLLSLGLALATGCTKPTTAREPSDSRVIRYTAGDDREPALIEVRGVQIAVAAPVSNALSVASPSTSATILIGMDAVPPLGPDEDPTCRFWLRGRPIVVHDGHLQVGARDYGSVVKGDPVFVDAAGVHVHDELRGELEN